MSESTVANGGDTSPEPHYEFRVWGVQKNICKKLSRLAAVERRQRLHDCYLLDGDPACNAKIRRSRLKVKRLEEERLGFQRWSTRWHRLPTGAPDPLLAELDEVLHDLEDCTPRSEEYDETLAKVVDELDPTGALRAVFVTKHRRRFRFGSIQAESTSVVVDGQPDQLSTVAIEGPDLHDLIQLRASLGLEHVPNLPLHVAVDPRHQIVAVR